MHFLVKINTTSEVTAMRATILNVPTTSATTSSEDGTKEMRVNSGNLYVHYIAR